MWSDALPSALRMADDLDFDDIILVFPPESGLKPL
ncbi:S-type pyocin domain-containing protein, partial [Pseudomonas aeruginosa]|nr:S-type pyocin domain-containing protein [Pseudomonas aeruginosa]